MKTIDNLRGVDPKLEWEAQKKQKKEISPMRNFLNSATLLYRADENDLEIDPNKPGFKPGFLATITQGTGYIALGAIVHPALMAIPAVPYVVKSAKKLYNKFAGK